MSDVNDNTRDEAAEKELQGVPKELLDNLDPPAVEEGDTGTLDEALNSLRTFCTSARA